MNQSEADFQRQTIQFAQMPKRNKYGAIRTYSPIAGRTFDSKAEANRGNILALREKAGEISDLEYQVKFKLCDKPRITITVDFRYVEDGVVKYEDAKGVLTRDSRTKFAWLQEKHGVVVELIR